MTKLTFAERALKLYYKAPITFDIIIIGTALLVEYIVRQVMINRGFPLLVVLDSVKDKTFYSSIISTLVSLSGFMIAALTIMITVKASLKARGYSDSENALDYLFTTQIYSQLLLVFKSTIVEFMLLFVITHVSWLCLSSANPLIIFKILCAVTFAMSTAMLRSLYIFFRVLNLENYKKETPKVESKEEKQIRLLQEILDKLSEKNATP